MKREAVKSTLCINLALQFLKERKDVVVLDTDSQQSAEVFVNIRAIGDRDGQRRLSSNTE